RSIFRTRSFTLKTIRSKQACAKSRRSGRGAAHDNPGSARFQRAPGLRRKSVEFRQRLVQAIARWKRALPGCSQVAPRLFPLPHVLTVRECFDYLVVVAQIAAQRLQVVSKGS